MSTLTRVMGWFRGDDADPLDMDSRPTPPAARNAGMARLGLVRDDEDDGPALTDRDDVPGLAPAPPPTHPPSGGNLREAFLTEMAPPASAVAAPPPAPASASAAAAPVDRGDRAHAARPRYKRGSYKLPVELLDRLRLESRRTGRYQYNVVRDALEQHLPEDPRS